MKMRTLSFVSVAMGLLGACAELPFETDNPDFISNDGRKVVSVCYSARRATRADVEKVASKACDPDGAAVTFLREDKLYNGCPIAAKQRASFLCAPSAPPTSPKAEK